MTISTVNPANGQTLRTFDALTEREIEAKLQRSIDAFAINRARSFADRATRMHAAADALDARKNELGKMITTEMGKPVKAAIAEVQKCALVCRYYAENAERHLSDEYVQTDAADSYIRFQPLGPVLAVMPWNFPLWQAMRFAAPALMAGNVALLKHASNVPQTALFMQDLFSRAGFPDGSFLTLLIGSDQVERVIADRRVVAATLTGSEGAGRSVAAAAGKHLKKTVLE